MRLVLIFAVSSMIVLAASPALAQKTVREEFDSLDSR